MLSFGIRDLDTCDRKECKFYLVLVTCLGFDFKTLNFVIIVFMGPGHRHHTIQGERDKGTD